MVRAGFFSLSAISFLFLGVYGASAANYPDSRMLEATPKNTSYNWNGFYIGAHLGEMRLSSNVSQTNIVVGGMHAGQNFQFNNWVFGVEGNFDLTELDDNVWMASIRGRAGYALNRLLFYTTGGVALAHFNIKAPPLGSDKNIHAGWTVGGGIEYAVTKHLTTRVEYRFSDYGAKKYSFAGIATRELDFDEAHSIRIGISYKF